MVPSHTVATSYPQPEMSVQAVADTVTPSGASSRARNTTLSCATLRPRTWLGTPAPRSARRTQRWARCKPPVSARGTCCSSPRPTGMRSRCATQRRAPHTAHTCNPVSFILAGVDKDKSKPKYTLKADVDGVDKEPWGRRCWISWVCRSLKK
ncbi:hypothetical protein B0H19DRAFT_137878 [Mycena capillaripes]|nr:hypothetical protein B0H19DRAFT_137878 [Mycena capillaripes]